MANDAIDTTRSPFLSVRCVGCNTHVVAVPEAVDPMCIQCRRDWCAIDWPWFEPVGEWRPVVGYCSPGQTWNRDQLPIVVKHDQFARRRQPMIELELPEDLGEGL